jgi:hypothetical protein
MRTQSSWLKTHIMVGVKTKVVTSIEVTPPNMSDHGQFEPLLKTAINSRYRIREVSADKAYSSRKNLRLLGAIGATPLIPFKSNTRVSANSQNGVA